jgi:hypothetical protein
LKKIHFPSRDGGFDKFGCGWNLIGIGLWREVLGGIFGELV